MSFTIDISYFLPLWGEILYWKQSTLKTYTWASKSVSYRFIGIDFMLRAWLLLMSEEEYLTNT